MLNLAKCLLALWLLLLGVAQGKVTYTAEPPLGNFFLNQSEAIQESPPETQNRNRDFDPFAWDSTPETRYCHNDPVNAVDVLGLAEHRFTIYDRATYLELFGMDAGTLLYDAFERRSDLYSNLGKPGILSYDIALNSVVHGFLNQFSDQQDGFTNVVGAGGLIWYDRTQLNNEFSHLIGPMRGKQTFRHDVHTGNLLLNNGTLAGRESTGIIASVYTVPVYRNYIDKHPIYWIATDTAAEHENAISFAASVLESGRVADLATQIAQIAPFGAVNRFIPGSSPIPNRNLKPPTVLPQAPRGPLASVIDGHGARQGFTGVFDTATGKVMIRPSTRDAVIPQGMVRRRGGHADVSAIMGGNSAQHSGFAVILQQNGSLNITWRSGTLNRTPDRLVPVAQRQAIIDAIEAATGRRVNR